MIEVRPDAERQFSHIRESDSVADEGLYGYPAKALTHSLVGLYCRYSKRYPYLWLMVVEPLLYSGRGGC